jgi:hypothetical protein
VLGRNCAIIVVVKKQLLERTVIQRHNCILNPRMRMCELVCDMRRSVARQ